MAYYPDLSKYEYSTYDSNYEVINVGWLDKSNEYTKGQVSNEVLNKILELCICPINRTRGYHLCPFCENPSFGVKIKTNNNNYIILGSAEIWVRSHDNIIFACPDLIYHYIKSHQYLPPTYFLNIFLHDK